MAEVFNLARIIAVQEDLVTIKMADSESRPLVKNEVVYVCPQRQAEDGHIEKLKPRC